MKQTEENGPVRDLTIRPQKSPGVIYFRFLVVIGLREQVFYDTDIGALLVVNEKFPVWRERDRC